MEARAIARSMSVQPRYNPLWDIPLGVGLGGIYSAVPPELLHQYGLGMEKYCFDFTWVLIALFNGGDQNQLSGATPSKNAKIDELDRRISLFYTRHSDLSMPRNSFQAGSYKLPYLQSNEYRALLYQVNMVTSAAEMFVFRNIFISSDGCLSRGTYYNFAS